jgi:hypothetical protein
MTNQLSFGVFAICMIVVYCIMAIAMISGV